MYFSDNGVCSEEDIQSKFRMLQSVFARIQEVLVGGKEFIDAKPSGTEMFGISTIIKLIAVLHILAYGFSIDQVDELHELGISASLIAFLGLFDEFSILFQNYWLWCSREANLKRIIKIMKRRGFSKSFETWKCQHWTRKTAQWFSLGRTKKRRRTLPRYWKKLRTLSYIYWRATLAA